MKGKSILLLDSEKNVLFTYKTVLEEEGFNVMVASCEDEAIDKLNNHPFDLLITEFYLKGLDTLSLIKKAQENKSDMYIIMLTASPLSPGTYQDVIEAGVQDCFFKPFPIHNLLVNIKKGLKRRELCMEKKELEDKLDCLIQFLLNQQSKICNTQYFLKALREELKRASRYQHTFTLMLLENADIKDNGTKSLSESNVKEDIDNILLSNTRQIDIITRYNGTYGFLLPETSESGTKILSDRLYKKLLDLQTIINESEHKDLSKGLKFISATYPHDLDFIKQCIDDLDKNMTSLAG